MSTHNFEAKKLDFGAALDLLVRGRNRVCRAGWNGKGMWLIYVPASQYGVAFGDPRDASGIPVADRGEAHIPANQYALDVLPWIGMKTADNKFVPWLASQTDILANDWELVE